MKGRGIYSAAFCFEEWVKHEMQNEDLDPLEMRQYDALIQIGDEVMSVLHASALRQETVKSAEVVNWLHTIYDLVQSGLGEPFRFADANEKELHGGNQSE